MSETTTDSVAGYLLPKCDVDLKIYMMKIQL